MASKHHWLDVSESEDGGSAEDMSVDEDSDYEVPAKKNAAKEVGKKLPKRVAARQTSVKTEVNTDMDTDEGSDSSKENSPRSPAKKTSKRAVTREKSVETVGSVDMDNDEDSDKENPEDLNFDTPAGNSAAKATNSDGLCDPKEEPVDVADVSVNFKPPPRNMAKLEPFDVVVESIMAGRSPEEVRDIAIGFMRSTYVRKSGELQPKLAQNPILLELHKKFTELEAAGDTDPEFEAIYDNLVSKSANTLELLKYFIYQVYHDDFNTSKDECFVTFYTGFRNRAFSQLNDAITACGLAQPDYNLVLDVTKGIEERAADRINQHAKEVQKAARTTCCQICLEPATHYCCPGGTYCSATCYEGDADHRAECSEELLKAPILIGAFKNNRTTYRNRLQASKNTPIPNIFE